MLSHQPTIIGPLPPSHPIPSYGALHCLCFSIFYFFSRLGPTEASARSLSSAVPRSLPCIACRYQSHPPGGGIVALASIILIFLYGTNQPPLVTISDKTSMASCTNTPPVSKEVLFKPQHFCPIESKTCRSCAIAAPHAL